MQLKIKYQISVAQSKQKKKKKNKQVITQKLLKLKKNLLITIMANILLLQNLISLQKKFDARLAQANLITKADFDTKLKSLNGKINSNKAMHLLIENEFKKLQIFD